jgi:hypothetical protein
MSKETGGPVFPSDYSLEENQGITLRDYLAAKALPVAWQAMADGYFSADGWESTNEGVAVCAYQMADAMIVARNA